MAQHDLIKIDTLVDMMRPEEAPYGPSKLLAKKFIKVDITNEKLPFTDKEFDICLCTHVLEDLASPFLVMNEMSRVAKKGLIVTPSMGEDMKFTPIDYTDWLTGARRVPDRLTIDGFLPERKIGWKLFQKYTRFFIQNNFR